MNTTDRSRVIHLADARAGIPGPAGEHSVSVLQRGTLDLKLSLPVNPNRQTPHEQDEIYMIVRGRGVLVHDGKRDAFTPGDIMFVAAGTEHCFEDFSDDLAVWVVFYGPRGGEGGGRGSDDRR
jgi:mannose-6-phosphate isomerase-like protein (cupin superfamily)